MQHDEVLGSRVNQYLENLGIETPMGVIDYNPHVLHESIASSHATIMKALNLRMNDESLQGTPDRVAKMYLHEIFYGLNYKRFPKCSTFENKANAYDEMLAVNCTVYSFCEHHFLPIIGTAHIGYIPKDRLLGLSKFNRVVDFFSRRPQVQERLTAQIHAALRYILDTEDVAVVIKAEHHCVKIRGALDDCGETTSSKLSGRFREVSELRSEFITLTRKDIRT